jgi:hypothetical protein
MSQSQFSKRHGYRKLEPTEITVREDAPHELRGVLIQLAYECGFRPKTLRPLVCKVLRIRPDDDNWSEYPNIDAEVRNAVDECAWYRVYDIIEAIASKMQETPLSYDGTKFEAELNEYFIERGIGWKIDSAVLSVRGPEALERSLESASETLHDVGLTTAANELREAIADLSRRPTPDVTGAIQHAMASLECVARKVCGDERATLGDVLKRYPDLLPRPLDEAVTKLWGYASENARHIREGREPSYAEAELVVSVAAGAGNYLARKHEA